MTDEFGDVNPFGLMSGMFGADEFTTDVDDSLPEEMQVAIRMIKASNALDDFMDQVEEKDLDLDSVDGNDMDSLDFETGMLVIGLMSMADPLSRIAEHLEDEDDDDNPFRLGDDDPIQ